MRVSIFGTGYVGVVASACLASFGHDVTAVDISDEKVAMLNRGQSPIFEAEIGNLVSAMVHAGRLRATTDAASAVAESELSFISVGTPSAPNGSVSFSAIDTVSNDIGRALRNKAAKHAVIMRSTVPPNTAEGRIIPLIEAVSGKKHGVAFEYFSNPEFLREASSVRDFHAPPFTLIGAPPGSDAQILRDLYGPIDAPIHVTSYRVAESVKYLSNVYHAVKLAFANEAGLILEAWGVDAPEAFRIFCEDRILNVSPAYLKPGFAFGGSCLPKDIRSFLALAQAKEIATPFLGGVMTSNQRLIDRAYEAVLRQGRQQVSLFGLAFKQGTDDLRESPFVALAERLIGRGFDLRIYDRSVQAACLVGANRRYIDQEIPHIERLLANSVDEALAGSRVVIIGHVSQDDRSTLIDGLHDQVVIDLANLKEAAVKPDLTYRGLYE